MKIEGEKVIPIEVKSGKIEDKPLRIFMKKFKAAAGQILVYDADESQITFDGMLIKVEAFYKRLL